jgi:methyl-accepting chemotaxis protein
VRWKLPGLHLDVHSVRGKMLFPAAVTIAATLIAIVVTITVSHIAADTLEQASKKDFRSLQLYQDIRRQLEQAQTELRVAGAVGDPYSISVAYGNHDEAIRLLKEEAPGIVDRQQAEKLEADIAEYFKVAQADALAQADAAKKHRGGKGGPSDDLKASANAEAAAALYGKLIASIDAETRAARDTIERRFVAVSRWQLAAWLVPTVILILAALGSGALAWWLSGKTALPLRTLSELTTRIAGGDLTPEVPVTSQDEVGVLADGFRRMVTRLREIVSTLKSASEELGLSAERLGDATRAQAAMLERQASGVAETGSTTRQLEQTSAVAANRAATVLEVAKRAAEMSESGRGAAERSADELKRIQDSIDSIVGQTGKLLDQARQVGNIVATVRDLAGQSHILSLNASIEAARAGDAGKGFAVVAQEVRALADQSGKSAGRIGKMVQEILAAVQATRVMTSQGSEAMAGSLGQIRASGESLREIGGIVQETSDAVQQIARVVQEQFAGIGQISTAMRDLDRGMEETVGRIRSLEESAQQVAETAMRISGIAAEFKV